MTATTSTTVASPARRAPGWVTAARAWLASPANFVLAGLSLLPPLFILLFVAARGSNTPLLDHWANTVPIAVKAADGTLTLADLVRQNFDHRVVFHNVITAILTWTTSWDLRVEMVLFILVVLACLGLLVALFRRDGPGALAVFLPVASALLFSLRHDATWLWTAVIGGPLTIMFLLAGLLALRRNPVGWRGLALAGACAVCMTLAQLQGLGGWPLLLAALWFRGYRHPKYYVGWAVLLAVSLGLYFSNYDFSLIGANEQGNSAGLVTSPLKIALYSLAYLGNPFVPSSGAFAPLATVIGVAGLTLVTLNAVVLWRRTRDLVSIGTWIVVAGFAIGSALLTALGRSHVYPERIPVQPLLDRYSLPPTMLWIALAALGLAVIAREVRAGAGVGRWLARLNLLVFVPLVGLYLFAGATVIPGRPAVSAEQAACVVNYPRARDAGCLALLYIKQVPLATVVRLIDQMAIHEIGSFAGRPAPFQAIIELHSAPRRVTQGGEAVGFTVQPIGEAEPIVLSAPAPAQVEFTVDVPQTNAAVQLITALYVAPDESGARQGTVRFAVGARRADGSVTSLADAEIDAAAQEGPQRAQLSLDAFKGEQIQLVFVTRVVNAPTRGTPLWADPIVVVRPDESAE